MLEISIKLFSPPDFLMPHVMALFKLHLFLQVFDILKSLTIIFTKNCHKNKLVNITSL